MGKKIKNKVKGLRTITPEEFLALEFNALKDSKRNVTKLVNAIKKNGWSFPAFVWENYVIDGAGRKLALQQLIKENYEIEEIPIVDIEAKNLKEAKAKVLEVSSQYGDITKDSFLFFADDLELDFDTFNIGGIDKDILITPDEKDDEVPEVPEKPKSKLGDLYELGEHRVLCGDSTKIDDVEKLMDGKKADMVFTDPPYGMEYVPNHSDKRAGSYNGAGYHNVKKQEAIIGDFEEFDPTFLLDYFKDVKEQFWWGYDYYLHNLPNLGRDGSIQVWNKRYGIESINFNTSHYELCWSKEKHLKRIWNIKWFGIQGTEQQDIRNRVHPTQKPIQLAEGFFNEWGNSGDIVADLFLGSGSTLIAAEKTGRICYGMELDAKYVDVIVQRYVDYVENPTVKLNGKEISWQKSK